jgi:hypothetical protein
MMKTRNAGPTQVRFTVSVEGMTYNLPGVKRGDVVAVPDAAEAQRLFKAGLAQPLSREGLAPAYLPTVD